MTVAPAWGKAFPSQSDFAYNRGSVGMCGWGDSRWSAGRVASMREDQEDSFMSLPAQKSTIEAQPLIAVRNVRASSRWYGELLGADSIPEHPHRDVYDRISHSGQLLLQLHAWDAEDHPNLVNADAAPPGHGVLLWFQVDDFDAVVERVRGSGAEIIEEPHVNPAPRHREIWLRDPDGYVVVVASPDGECGSSYGRKLVRA